VRCILNIKENYLTTKYRSVGIVLKCQAIFYFKFKLQLKFRKNTNYSYIIAKFHTGLH